MFTKKEIDKVKKGIPKSISYKMIAEASNGKASLGDVKKFYTHINIPFEKGLQIFNITKTLILQQEEKKQRALAE